MSINAERPAIATDLPLYRLHLRGVPIVLPLATVIGAALGGLGGELRAGLPPRRRPA